MGVIGTNKKKVLKQLIFNGELIDEVLLLDSILIQVYHHNSDYYQVIIANQNQLLGLTKVSQPKDLDAYLETIDISEVVH